MLLIVFNVLVEVVVISFLGRGDNKTFYGQQCVLTETVLLKIRSCFVSEVTEPKSSAL